MKQFTDEERDAILETVVRENINGTLEGANTYILSTGTLKALLLEAWYAGQTIIAIQSQK